MKINGELVSEADNWKLDGVRLNRNFISFNCIKICTQWQQLVLLSKMQRIQEYLQKTARDNYIFAEDKLISIISF